MRLPENELAKELEVSTNSLREAFRLMENLHLVELQPRKGVRVCEVNPQQVRDLYDFLFLLLSRLAAQAAERWQDGQIEDLIAMVDELRVLFQNNDLPAAHEVAFRFLQTANQRFAHNAYLAQDPPSKEHLLFHIGNGTRLGLRPSGANGSTANNFLLGNTMA